jgi:hypothetical protein
MCNEIYSVENKTPASTLTNMTYGQHDLPPTTARQNRNAVERRPRGRGAFAVARPIFSFLFSFLFLPWASCCLVVVAKDEHERPPSTLERL